MVRIQAQPVRILIPVPGGPQGLKLVPCNAGPQSAGQSLTGGKSKTREEFAPWQQWLPTCLCSDVFVQLLSQSVSPCFRSVCQPCAVSHYQGYTDLQWRASWSCACFSLELCKSLRLFQEIRKGFCLPAGRHLPGRTLGFHTKSTSGHLTA